MSNNTIYPYGTGGTLPSSIGIINDLKTGGADKALSAEQGKIIGTKWDGMFRRVLFQNSTSADWKNGNVSNGVLITNYANRYLIIPELPEGVTELVVKRGTPPDTTYTLGVYGSLGGTTWTDLESFGTSGGENTYQIGSYDRLLLLLWDKPTTERAQQESIEITYEIPGVLADEDISNSPTGNEGKVAGINLVRSINAAVFRTYENPIIREDAPDPTVWDGDDGYFYLFSTGNLASAKMFRSANLIQWEKTGDAPFNADEAQKVATAFGQSTTDTSFWAPHVYKINPTTWNLYLSKPDNGGIAILTSNHPTRNYRYVTFLAHTAQAGQFIDAEIGVDLDGKTWMYTGGSKSIHRREMTADGLAWKDGSSFELCAGLETSTSREETYEAPYLYRRKGYWYLFCSSGRYNGNNYKIRVVRASSLGGTFVDRQGNYSTNGYAETVLVSNGTVLKNPGHDAQIFVDSNNDTWILYHCHWSGFEDSSTRGVCIDKIQWDNEGWPYVENGMPSLSHGVPAFFR